MLRLLTFYVSLTSLALVINTSRRLKLLETPTTNELTKTYVVAERAMAAAHHQLKERSEQADFTSIFFLPRQETLLSDSIKVVFTIYHGHQSFYGSLYPSGPSPPQVVL